MTAEVMTTATITTEQILLFALLGGVFAMLLWGKVRYDLIAFGALTVAVLIGVVPEQNAFDGFGHHATIIIALVLIVSRGLSNSGAVELIARHILAPGRKLIAHIGVMSGVAAALSALMNNVAALALLMPIDLQAAARAKRSPALSLMPLSFASILGGLITLIGTPPNIIIASYREQELGEAFGMFDFSPVGLVAAIVGVIYIAVIGWRLIPSGDKNKADALAFEVEQYVAELRVAEKSIAIGQKIRELDEQAEAADVAIIGLVRRGKRFPGHARREVIKKGDLLVIEANAEGIDGFVGEFGLEYIVSQKHEAFIGEDLSLLGNRRAARRARRRTKRVGHAPVISTRRNAARRIATRKIIPRQRPKITHQRRRCFVITRTNRAPRLHRKLARWVTVTRARLARRATQQSMADGRRIRRRHRRGKRRRFESGERACSGMHHHGRV